MKPGLVTIGKFCKDIGIAPSKLRYYESLGLISPAYVDGANGYRYYSYEQYEQYDMIQICRELDFSVKEIQRMVQQKETSLLMKLIKRQKEQKRQTILQQQELLRHLSWLSDTWQRELALESDYAAKPQLLQFSERKVLLTKLSDDYDLRPTEEQEAQLQQKAFQTRRECHAIHRVYGYQLDRTSFLRGKFSLKGKFLQLNRYTDAEREHLFRIPAGTYLTMPVRAFTDTAWIAVMTDAIANQHLSVQRVFLTEVALHLIPQEDAYYYVQALVDA